MYQKLISAGIIVVASTAAFGADEFFENQKVLGSGGSGEFGVSVDIDGDKRRGYSAIIGERFNGLAHIYESDGEEWTLTGMLKGDASGEFGRAVAIDGDWAVVGSYVQDLKGAGDAGLATLYQRGENGWVLHSYIEEPEFGTNHRFGHSVAISGNHMVIGADGWGSNYGQAYVYRLDEGPELINVLNPWSGGGGRFGQKVRISDNVIGVLQPDAFNGAVYLYDLNLMEEYTSVPPHGYFWGEEHVDMEGFKIESFDLDSSRVIVGNYSHSSQRGRAAIGQWDWDDDGKYIFTFPYHGATIINADNAADWDQFGLDVQIDGNTALVSAQDDHFTNNAGSVYAFEYDEKSNDWMQWQQIVASDYGDSDDFGYSISLSAGHLLVGAPHDDDNGNNSGSAYMFYSGPALRACCTNNTCVIAYEEDCEFYGGQWQGTHMNCVNTCETTQPCLGDLTDDGVVDVNDLLVLLAVWGNCP